MDLAGLIPALAQSDSGRKTGRGLTARQAEMVSSPCLSAYSVGAVSGTIDGTIRLPW